MTVRPLQAPEFHSASGAVRAAWAIAWRAAGPGALGLATWSAGLAGAVTAGIGFTLPVLAGALAPALLLVGWTAHRAVVMSP